MLNENALVDLYDYATKYCHKHGHAYGCSELLDTDAVFDLATDGIIVMLKKYMHLSHALPVDGVPQSSEARPVMTVVMQNLMKRHAERASETASPSLPDDDIVGAAPPPDGVTCVAVALALVGDTYEQTVNEMLRCFDNGGVYHGKSGQSINDHLETVGIPRSYPSRVRTKVRNGFRVWLQAKHPACVPTFDAMMTWFDIGNIKKRPPLLVYLAVEGVAQPCPHRVHALLRRWLKEGLPE